jgi:hypothetical protein
LASEYLKRKLGSYSTYQTIRKDDSSDIAILVREISAIENIQFQEFPLTPQPAMMAEVKFKNGTLLRAVNVHLKEGNQFSETRTQQLVGIMNWIKEIEAKEAADFLILGGDFNTGINAESISDSGAVLSIYDGEFDVFLQDPNFEFLLRPNDHKIPTFFDPTLNVKYRTNFIFSSQQKREHIEKLGVTEKIYPLIDLEGVRLSDHDAVLHKFTIEYATPSSKSDF